MYTMFRAKYVYQQFKCNGCRSRLYPPWYRCLECEDIDICSSCFNNGDKNITDFDHKPNHYMVFMRYDIHVSSLNNIPSRWNKRQWICSG